MTICTACGAENIEGAKFCVRCGTAMTAAPDLGAWRSGEEADRPPLTDQASTPAGGYVPQPPPSSYPTYTPPQGMSYQQTPTGSQPMHPAIPALVSLFLPGLGLLFVPNKAGLGLGIFGAFVALNIVLFILAVVTLGIGTCLFAVVPLANVAAAVHSWDEAAKSSNGQFQPILFK